MLFANNQLIQGEHATTIIDVIIYANASGTLPVQHFNVAVCYISRLFIEPKTLLIDKLDSINPRVRGISPAIQKIIIYIGEDKT